MGVSDEKGIVFDGSGGLGRKGQKDMLNIFMTTCIGKGNATAREDLLTDFIPVCKDGHWEVIFITREGTEN